jgi:hypothetical protein
MQLDLFAARAARDEGLERVCKEPWMERALRMIGKTVPRGGEMTSEELREWLALAGLEPPHHHNTWGALTMAAVRRGLLEDTGRTGQMRGPKSHARRTPIWRRV